MGRTLSKRYQALIRKGLEPDRPMPGVSDATMDMPIRMSSKRKRRDVNPRQAQAINATGQTASSISSKRTGNEVEISSNSDLGDRILESNAFPSKADNGAIKGRRVKRDPLRLTDYEEKLIEDAVIRDFDRILGI